MTDTENLNNDADGGLSSHDLLAVLVALPEDERNAAYVDANCWRWPSPLERYKQCGFEQMGDREKMEDPAWKSMWSAIHQCTSEFGRSQAWWVVVLDRTREAHAVWWVNRKRPVDTANTPEQPPAPTQNDDN